MDLNDEPPCPTLDQLAMALDQGMKDVAAGRVVPGDAVLAELDAAIAQTERQGSGQAIDAA